jgi:hypothetical protein
MTAGDASPAAGETIRVRARHLGGVRGLAVERGELELRFSDAGLHIFDAGSRKLLGQLSWGEIRALEIGHPRRLVRRRAPRLDVATRDGRARFELPGLTDRQVEEHLAPLRKRAGGGE